MTDRYYDGNLTIGQFGQLCQLSRKALRLYEQRGVLLPASVDSDSGYRYYTREQIEVARRIRLLRLMEMPLDDVAAVLAAWDQDEAAVQRLVSAQIARTKKRLAAVQLAARLLLDELSPDKEISMTFTFDEQEHVVQKVVSIRRNITVPAYHQWMRPALQQLKDHIAAAGAEATGDPVALYYGPVNEEDDGPVEICVPFRGTVPPRGEIKVRELPAHKAVQIRTFGEYNEYPKLLEMWNGLGRHVHDEGLESNWDADMTTYEIWHEDRTMTICWPVREFAGQTAV